MPIKVYVGNLPDNCPPDSLRDLFSGYGVLKELDIIKNFAFVHFDRESDATQAVKDLDNTKLLGQVITVQVSKNQTSKSNSRDRDRRDDRRPPRRNPNGPMSNNRGPPPPMNSLGGILGAAPVPAPLGGLGLLSSLNAAVAAEQQRNLESELRLEREHRERGREREQPNPDVRVRREVVHTRDVPNASKLGVSDGYVIYERYYVDPSHPLLKGLPTPEYSRVTDTFVAPRDNYRSEDVRRDGFNEFRDRSPLQDPRDYERERGIRDVRDRDIRDLRESDPYSRPEYFDRR